MRDGDGAFIEALKRERRDAGETIRNFVAGVKTSDVELIRQSVRRLELGNHPGGGWYRAMREVSKLHSVPRRTRDIFLQVYVQWGDHIRQGCANDLALADGLRMLLPRYTGRGMRLFRGEGAHNRRRHAYGLSWTTSAHVARVFALGIWRTTEGGSLILATDAPKEAIICALGSFDNRYSEQECLVDRRRLRAIRVVERFAQVSVEEYGKGRAGRDPVEADNAAAYIARDT